MIVKDQLKILDNKIRQNKADYDSSVKWGLLARNEVGLFQIFNHVKTIKNH